MRRTTRASRYLSAIDSIEGPLVHIGLSESVISGNAPLTAESLTSVLKLSMYSVISLR